MGAVGFIVKLSAFPNFIIRSRVRLHGEKTLLANVGLAAVHIPLNGLLVGSA